MTIEQTLAVFKKMTANFLKLSAEKTYTLSNDVVITLNGVDWMIGAKIYIMDENMNLKTLEDGQYMLKDGTNFYVKDGMISEEVIEVEASAEIPVEEVAEVIEEAPIEEVITDEPVEDVNIETAIEEVISEKVENAEIEEKFNNLEEYLKTLINSIEQIKTQSVTLSAEFEKFKKQPGANGVEPQIIEVRNSKESTFDANEEFKRIQEILGNKNKK